SPPTSPWPRRSSSPTARRSISSATRPSAPSRSSGSRPAAPSTSSASAPPSRSGAVEEHDRVDPPLVADEKATLNGFLDFHRDTFLWKIDGLTPEQMRAVSVPSSDLTLGGLLRHLAEVDRGWFHDFDGEELPPLYCTEADPDGD